MENDLTQEYLKSILHYDPDVGIFTWLKLPKLNRQKVGNVAGNLLSTGYLCIRIKKKCLAHRLAWFYMTGKWPKDQIDHINRIKNDNRWINLRECSQSQNNANENISSNNTSGFKGVTWSKVQKKWQAQIRFKRNLIYLGKYNDIKDAAVAYNDKAVELYGEFANLNKVVL